MIKLTQEELNELIANHALFLTDYDKGVRLELFNHDLSELRLTSANLQSARFINCHMQNVDVSYADLSYSQFVDCELSNSDLRHTNLKLSNISNCKVNNINLAGSNMHMIEGLKQYSVDNVGTFEGKITYLADHDMVFAGCWNGTFDEFKLKCKECIRDAKKYGNYPNIKKELNATIKFFESVSK